MEVPYTAPFTSATVRRHITALGRCFLTELCDENEGDWLLRPARVLPLAGFQQASGGDYSDDVFLCEYEYNKGFQVLQQS